MTPQDSLNTAEAKAATIEGYQRRVEAACIALSAQEQELLYAVVRHASELSLMRALS